VSRPGRALLPWNRSVVLIGQEAGWVSEPVWTQRPEKKNPLLLPKIEARSSSLYSDTTLTELPQLLFSFNTC